MGSLLDFFYTRVAALGGDRVPRVAIDEDCSCRIGDVVPEGHVLTAWDNDGHGTPIATYDPFPASLIKGRVVFRYWPPSRATVWFPGGQGLRLRVTRGDE